MKQFYFAIFYLFWASIVLFFATSPGPIYPVIRERFGTIMWHSDDNTPASETAEHIYCYYPKKAANTYMVIKKVDSGDCSDWYGEAILTEGSWVTDIEKFWWCDKQVKQDTYDCGLTQKATQAEALNPNNNI